MKTIFLVMLTMSGILLRGFSYGQSSTGKISGNILDSNHKPVDGATVTLVGATDSAVYKNEISSPDGSFTFEGIKLGDYKIWVQIIGAGKYRSDVISLDAQHFDIKLPIINIQYSGIALKEITVTSKKPLVERKIDRTVVNVDALLSNTGSSAFDVLEKSPGVQVDQSGSISLKGKQGVVIFIDDKPTYLSGDDLASYLKSLPSSSLDQIELMTNPPAKYEASGNAGVINIRTKKTKMKGFNGGLSLNFGQGRYTRTNTGFNFNYREDKVNVFGNISVTTQQNFTDLDISRRYKKDDGSTDSYFLQNSFGRQTSQAYESRIGMDYYQSPNTTVGFVVSGLFRPFKSHTLSNSQLLNAGGMLDSIIAADNNEKNKFKNGTANLNYRHQFKKKGAEISADLDYVGYSSRRDQLFDNTTYANNGAVTEQDRLTGNLPSNISIVAAKTDYVNSIGNNYNIAAGLKSSFTNTDNDAKYFSVVGNTSSPDYDKTNHFIYKENINAAYVNLNKDFKRLSIQAGLRLENTHSKGDQLGNVLKADSSFKRSYTNLFPTLYLTYKFDSAAVHQVGLNYGRRIDRPYYQDLNPFLSPVDKFTYYVGNPFLNPSFSQKIEFSYTYDNKVTASVSYNKSKDEQSETIQIIDGIYYSRPGNIGNTDTKSISVDGGFDPTRWFSFHLYGELTSIHSRSTFYTGFLDTKGTYVYLQGMAQFKLSETWNAQLDGSFQSKRTSAQFVTGSRGRLNFGLSKKLSSAASIKLVLNDIFYAYQNNGVINNLASADATFHSRGDSRWGILTFTYKFGKSISNQSKHQSNGVESEQNRIKN